MFQTLQNKTIPLYPKGEIPFFQNGDDKEYTEQLNGSYRYRLVDTPDLNIFLPSQKNSTGYAMVICPGGGYEMLSYDWEGTDIARWLNSKGIAGIVLKYRLPLSQNISAPENAPLADALRAIRIVKHRAREWYIDPGKVGIIGFSAGGHLASMACNMFDDDKGKIGDKIDRECSRPDFAALIYPVISSHPDIRHDGSFKALSGAKATQEQMDEMSTDKLVSSETPPTILIHASDDEGVPYQNSTLYFDALQKHKIPSEMHIFSTGGHGFSLGLGIQGTDSWPDIVSKWIFSL